MNFVQYKQPNNSTIYSGYQKLESGNDIEFLFFYLKQHHILDHKLSLSKSN